MLLKQAQLIDGQLIQITGSKSISNRLLILAQLYTTISIDNLSNSHDTAVLKKALRSTDTTIDIHHAGTAMRFLTAYFATQADRDVILTGSDRMKQRPIKDLVTALQSLGADISYMENDGYPPLKINGKKLKKNTVEIPANISSQFITAMMLVGSTLEHGLNIQLLGEITSRPYLEMTIEMLSDVGLNVSFERQIIAIKPQTNPLPNQRYTVESDWSSASYYYSLAAIGRKTITLKSFKNQSLQGDSILQKIYQTYFGINSYLDEETNHLCLTPEHDFDFPNRITLDMNDCPDIAQTLCVTASALKIPFYITGLQTLKVKETDRLVALQNELNKLGTETKIDNCSISSITFGDNNHRPIIETYNDHRMAMAFAPVALQQDIEIVDENVVEKSYPTFWQDFAKVTERR